MFNKKQTRADVDVDVYEIMIETERCELITRHEQTSTMGSCKIEIRLRYHASFRDPYRCSMFVVNEVVVDYFMSLIGYMPSTVISTLSQVCFSLD